MINSNKQDLINITEYSISELSSLIKLTIESNFSYVRVKGEVSGYRGPHSSGHAYFALKDHQARIEAVIWKGTFNKLKFLPEEGIEFILIGKITTFPGSSKYQIIIEKMMPSGVGALMALLEERKKKFENEGLFAIERKRPIPFMPKIIAVVTSPTGAVIRDILHRISCRFSLHVIVWPIKVQGEGSGQEIANAIQGLNSISEENLFPKPDVIIVARGGGSIEDLWSFNDEIVVRAAANSNIPIISAIGHETDWTLLDYVADLRAPTPTAAAEMAVPVKADLEELLNNIACRLQEVIKRHMKSCNDRLLSLIRCFPSCDQILSCPRYRFDKVSLNLEHGFEITKLHKLRSFKEISLKIRSDLLINYIFCHRQKIREKTLRFEYTIERFLNNLAIRINNSATVLRIFPENLNIQKTHIASRVKTLTYRAETIILDRIKNHKIIVSTHNRVLQSLSHYNVLHRGYAAVRDKNNKPITKSAKLLPSTEIIIEFSDGNSTAIINTDRKSLLLKKNPSLKTKKPTISNQGNLF